MPDREHTEEWARSVLDGPLEISKLDAAKSLHIFLHRNGPSIVQPMLKPMAAVYLFRETIKELGDEDAEKLTEAHTMLPIHPIDPED